MIVKEKMLLNGAKYSGNIENNIPHGYGVYETNNLKYEGYFYNGLFDSYGILTDKLRNYKYEGYFKLGNKEGFGQISFNDGRYFEGIFKGNSANGMGYMKYSDGEIYVGEFKNNLSDGDGTVYYSNGNIYTGQFKNDKECGLGVVMEKDNRSYGIKVEYKEDGYTLIHGQIKLTSELNTHMVYRIVEKDDFIFFGMIDKYSNLVKGIYHYKNHKDFKIFVGNISEEFKNGLLIFNNNNLYSGFIENDELTGKGELNVLGKGKYIGEYVNGLKTGEFQFIDYDGEKYHYVYDNDKLSNTRKEIQ